MDRSELAWAAGFWDGEGSVYLSGALDRRRQYPQARINQASSSGPPEVLTSFQRAVGAGRVQGPEHKAGREPLYKWVLSDRTEILAVFALLWPWLGPVKRSQFKQVVGETFTSSDGSLVVTREEQIAWAAGLFDGEGSVYLAKHRSHAGYFRLEAAITQSDPAGTPFVLRKFREATSFGFVKGPYPSKPGWDPPYRWKLYRADEIERLIDMLSPWLGSVKRQQAAAVIALVRSQAPLPRGNPAWGNRKALCVNGHEYAAARIRPFQGRGKNKQPPRASKQCLACLREHASRKRAEKKQRRASSPLL